MALLRTSSPCGTGHSVTVIVPAIPLSLTPWMVQTYG
jgi:hypothetical protein